MNNDPRYIENDPELNDAGRYTTASGDIEPGTVEYVLDLLNKTVGNPHQTVSKDKLKHIAAQLLARNAMVERENDVLRKRNRELADELARVVRLANTKSLTINTDNNLTEEQKREMGELVRNSINVGREYLAKPGS